MFEDKFIELPVIINDCYGDPFFPSQLEDTITKLESLRYHKGPISIITKMKVKPEVTEKIKRFSYPNLIIFYSFTGLNEGGFSFEDRKKSFEELCNSHDNVVMYLRPIIPGKNDNPENIRKIIDIAKENDKKVVYGGFKENGSRKKVLAQGIEDFIQNYCSLVGTEYYTKSSCAISEIMNIECFAHVDSEPKNLETLDFLGYKYRQNLDGKIELENGTLGDRNFVRFLTRSQPIVKNLNITTNILSISDKERTYEATSSWFLWSRNISNCIGCDYCMIPRIAHLKEPKSIGCNPVDLSRYTSKFKNKSLLEVR
jgi:hypothetical protein